MGKRGQRLGLWQARYGYDEKNQIMAILPNLPDYSGAGSLSWVAGPIFLGF